MPHIDATARRSAHRLLLSLALPVASLCLAGPLACSSESNSPASDEPQACVTSASCGTPGFECGSYKDPCTSTYVNCGPCSASGTGGGASAECVTSASCGTAGFACGSFKDPCTNTYVNCGPCAAGGSSGDPAPTALPTVGIVNGSSPGNFASAASEAYARFASHLSSCGSMTRVVAGDTPGQGDVVSEGIGYGMLLAVSHDKKDIFDGLLAYYKAAIGSSGLMAWDVQGCPPTIKDQTPATDADLDVAMSLIMAQCRWGGSYGTDATSVINKLATVAVSTVGGTYVLKPGYSGSKDLNPSYFSPAYYRAFAYQVPSAADTWMSLAKDTYVMLNKGANASTGLVPDWMSYDGGTSGVDGHGHDYKYDAARAPWRIAIDYLWWGSPDAKVWLDRITSWAGGISPGNVVDGYHLDGSAFSWNHNEAFVGGFAVGAMASNASTSTAYFNQLVSMNTNSYYPDTLRALYLTAGAGMFVACPSP